MILTLPALPSLFREARNPSLWFPYRLSWLSDNLLASAGSLNVTFMEMTTPKSTGIWVFVSQGMSWKVSSAFNDMTIKPVREGRRCHAHLVFHSALLQAEISLAETSVPVPTGRWPGRKLKWKILTVTFLPISFFPTVLKSLGEVENFG